MQRTDAHDELARIRGLMDRSTRFLSLSGLSGVVAGVVALLGAFAAQWYMRDALLVSEHPITYHDEYISETEYRKHLMVLALMAIAVLVTALAGALWFTWRRTRRMGQFLFNATSLRLLMAMLVPLAGGGIFCLALLLHGLPGLVPASTLVFYGLALVNASKFTLDEIRWLGYSELVLGLCGLFWPGAGLMFWAIGFGVLHVFYGALMYVRHEMEDRTPAAE